MFKFTIALALFALAAAVPIRVEEDALSDSSEAPEVIAILKSESNQNADGSYNFMFEGSDGTYRQENAEIVSVGSEEEKGIKITGSYKYIDANGDEIVVTYTADENGFVPVGTNINKEISDAAIAAKDLPKEEPPQAKSLKTVEKPKSRSLKVEKEEPKAVEEPKIEAVPEPVSEESVESVESVEKADEPVAEAESV